MTEVVTITGVLNQEFLETHARPGRVGLSGGIRLIDKAITRAERHIDEEGRWSLWSHSFFPRAAGPTATTGSTQRTRYDEPEKNPAG